MSVAIEAKADGEEVVIRLGANDADRLSWALNCHARRSICALDYRKMAEVIDVAVADAFDNGAVRDPGLAIRVVPREAPDAE